MEKLRYYSAAASRELDRLTIEEYGIPGFELMQRAGRAAFDALLTKWPDTRKLIILCGTGNNGGDGFIIGVLAQNYGLQVTLFLAGNKSRIKGDAKKAMDYALKHKVNISPSDGFTHFQNEELPDSGNTVLVDALLGTGLENEVREPFLHLIEQINNIGLPVLAVDIPSGLCSDTGEVLGQAVKADMTVTFIGRKIGLIKKSAPEYIGELKFDDLGVPAEVYSRVSSIEGITPDQLKN